MMWAFTLPVYTHSPFPFPFTSCSRSSVTLIHIMHFSAHHNKFPVSEFQPSGFHYSPNHTSHAHFLTKIITKCNKDKWVCERIPSARTPIEHSHTLYDPQPSCNHVELTLLDSCIFIPTAIIMGKKFNLYFRSTRYNCWKIMGAFWRGFRGTASVCCSCRSTTDGKFFFPSYTL